MLKKFVSGFACCRTYVFLLLASIAVGFSRGEEGFYLALHADVEEKLIVSRDAESIHSINYVVPFKKKLSDYLFVNVSLVVAGGFEDLWRGDLIVKKNVQDCWSEVQIFQPREVFDLSLVKYYSEKEILKMMDESFDEDFLKLNAALAKLNRSSEHLDDLVKKKAFLLYQYRNQKKLNLDEYTDDFEPVEMDTRNIGLESIFPEK